MKHAFLLTVLLVIAPAAVLADPAPAPTPSVSVEAGGSSNQLTNNRGTWSEADLQVIANGRVSAYGLAANDQRFGFDDHWYEGALYIPTGTPRGTVSVDVGFSPEHHILAQSQYNVGYDRRTGGGYGFQVGYTGRTYPGLNVQEETLGFDHYYGDQRLAVSVNGATLSNVPGLAVSYNARWSMYAPTDTVNVAASAGRDVENTGTAIAVFQATGLDVDELHWISHGFAVHAGAGFYNLAGAYGRFEVRLGLRERF